MFQIQAYCHLINDSHCATLTQLRKHLFRFVRTHIVVSQNAFHILHALGNNLLIVRTAVLSEQELKDIGGHICPFLDLLCQVFTDNPAVEMLTEFLLDDLTSASARFKIFHLPFLPGSILLEEVKLIHCKCNIDLELLPLHLQSVLVSNDEIVGFCILIL